MPLDIECDLCQREPRLPGKSLCSSCANMIVRLATVVDRAPHLYYGPSADKFWSLPVAMNLAIAASGGTDGSRRR